MSAASPTPPTPPAVAARAPDLDAFIAALPKVELHLHLVGAASLDTVLVLARRHGSTIVPTDRTALREFYRFVDFPHFLQTYFAVNLLVSTGADVVTLLDGLAAELAAHRVRYAEITVTPVRNRMAGIGYSDLAAALVDGRALAAERHGVQLGWIFDADAALGVPGAEETLEFALRHRPAGTVGLGLAGPEIGIDRRAFAPIFRRAIDGGLHSIPHAGETVGPQDVWISVRELGAERIAHGIGAAPDPALLDHLGAHGIALDMCPTSNIRTGAVARPPNIRFRRFVAPAFRSPCRPTTRACSTPI